MVRRSWCKRKVYGMLVCTRRLWITLNVIKIVFNSIFILLKKVYLKRFYQDLKNEVFINLLDIEYTNNEFIYVYIQYFEHLSRRIRKDVYRILFYNDYKSHLM